MSPSNVSPSHSLFSPSPLDLFGGGRPADPICSQVPLIPPRLKDVYELQPDPFLPPAPPAPAFAADRLLRHLAAPAALRRLLLAPPLPPTLPPPALLSALSRWLAQVPPEPALLLFLAQPALRALLLALPDPPALLLRLGLLLHFPPRFPTSHALRLAVAALLPSPPALPLRAAVGPPWLRALELVALKRHWLSLLADAPAPLLLALPLPLLALSLVARAEPLPDAQLLALARLPAHPVLACLLHRSLLARHARWLRTQLPDAAPALLRVRSLVRLAHTALDAAPVRRALVDLLVAPSPSPLLGVLLPAHLLLRTLHVLRGDAGLEEEEEEELWALLGVGAAEAAQASAALVLHLLAQHALLRTDPRTAPRALRLLQRLVPHAQGRTQAQLRELVGALERAEVAGRSPWLREAGWFALSLAPAPALASLLRRLAPLPAHSPSLPLDPAASSWPALAPLPGPDTEALLPLPRALQTHLLALAELLPSQPLPSLLHRPPDLLLADLLLADFAAGERLIRLLALDPRTATLRALVHALRAPASGHVAPVLAHLAASSPVLAALLQSFFLASPLPPSAPVRPELARQFTLLPRSLPLDDDPQLQRHFKALNTVRSSTPVSSSFSSSSFRLGSFLLPSLLSSRNGCLGACPMRFVSPRFLAFRPSNSQSCSVPLSIVPSRRGLCSITFSTSRLFRLLPIQFRELCPASTVP